MSPTERSVRDKTHHAQETDVHIRAGIWVHNPRKQKAEDSGLDRATTGISQKCHNVVKYHVFMKIIYEIYI